MFFVSFERTAAPCKHEIDPQIIINKLCTHATPDKSGFIKKDRAFLVQALYWNTPSSLLEPAPLYHAPSETFVVSWARIDNGEELIRELGIPQSFLKELSDSELILQSYLKWGEECINHLIGDFVFAIYDRKKEKLFCGRDHMGIRPFYYYLSQERFVCATSLAALAQAGGVPVEPDEQWICKYLCQLSMSWVSTPYRDILKLAPAHTLSVTAHSHQLRQYFQLSDIEEIRLKNSQEYVEAYQEKLEEAIKCRLKTNYPLGSELSGGLDSSSITAFAAKLFDRPLNCFHAFSFSDHELEPTYINAVSTAWSLPNVHLLKRSFLTEEEFKLNMAVYAYPPEIEAGSMMIIYRAAEAVNVRTLLSGFGGDEFVTTHNGDLAIPELLLKGKYKKLYRILPGTATDRLRKLVKLQIKKSLSYFYEQSAYNPDYYKSLQARLPHLIICRNLFEQYNLLEKFMNKARLDAGYSNLKNFIIERMWEPFFTTRMEVNIFMAATRKIEYCWPLVDVRLIKIFLQIPSEENYFRGTSRYLHRRAVSGIVPDCVAWNKNKSMGGHGNSILKIIGNCKMLIFITYCSSSSTSRSCKDSLRALPDHRFPLMSFSKYDLI